MMAVEVAAEAILSVLALEGFVDDIAVMPRAQDPKASPAAQDSAKDEEGS